MLKLSLCDYSGTYILADGTITITGGTEDATDGNKCLDESNKGVIFKNCAPFIDCISEIDNSQVDNAKDLGVVMPVYNLTEYSDN